MMSIKNRLTLWYSLVLLIVTGLALAFLLYVSGHLVRTEALQELRSAVEWNSEQIVFREGKLRARRGFAFSINGVTSIIYARDHTRIAGYPPTGFSTQTPFENDALRLITDSPRAFYVYDRLLELTPDTHVWIRSVTSAEGRRDLLQMGIRVAFLLLPALFILAVLIGYAIAQRAFSPIEQIVSTANKISSGDDLSKRIALEEQAEELQNIAQAFDRMFSRLEKSFQKEKQFTSDISHELRTPTTVILSQCEYALEGPLPDEEYREVLQSIQRQGTRISRTLAQLLAIARLEQGLLRPTLEQTDVSELLSQLCSEYEMTLTKEVAFTHDIEKGITLNVDTTLLARLLFNLLNNAQQFTPSGGAIRVELKREKSTTRLRVEDTGVGMSPEELNKIWDRFYRAESSRTQTEWGNMGLGLSMAQQIAALHGATLTASSTQGKGSCFSLEWTGP